ncbi:hypothetical protein ABZS66_28085 [Dactylosporangium sp. NPDC005572]|uniref:hypothetical protein n=1 Tax=Dactylosporangium sp. NPDC005572 TaxID=3156889 RepID=UPI0033BE1942
MLSTPEPPELAEDAYTMQITTEPTVGELGVHTFGRNIAVHVARLLDVPVATPVYRENRQDRRRLPKASTYALTAAAHTVLISMFDVKHALIRDTMPAYTIHLDGVRVPFELGSYRDVDWQLARTIWLAISDLHIAADRQAREAAEQGNAAAADPAVAS